MLPNASFEVDWRRSWRSTPVLPSVDAEKPFHGRQCLRWDIESPPIRFVSQLVEFAGRNKPLALRLAARAKGKVVLTATVWPGARLDGTAPVLQVRCEPKADWAVFETRCAVPSSPTGAYYVEITLDGKEGAAAWLDAVRLELGAAAGAMRCRRKLEASLSCDRPAHVFHEGQPVTLRAAAFNDGDQRRTVGLVCRVSDFDRRIVCNVPLALTLDAKQSADAAVTLPIPTTGVFLAELLDGEDVVSELSLSVLPPVSPVPPEASVVGGHFRLDEFHLSAANAMGVKRTRIHDCESITHWNTVEPERGRFVWFDDKVRLARRHHLKLLGEFLRVPRWASSAGPDVARGDAERRPPRDLDEFAAYVRAVVGHYKDDIRDWEIWNEPYHDGFWQGTPQQYAELARVACRVVHDADPGANTLAPCAYPGAVEWVDAVFAAGGLADADIFSYHGYELFGPESYRRVGQWASRGRTAPMPVWNTETGVSSRTFYRRLPEGFSDSYTNWLRPMAYDLAAEQSVKLFVMALAGGAERYFHYWCVWEDTLLPRLSGMTVFEYDGSLRPMGASYAVAASLLDGTRGEGFIELPAPALASLFRDDRRMIAVLWRQSGRRQRRFVVPLDPSTLDARDIWGNPVPLKRSPTGLEVSLTGRPLYLIAPIAHAKLLTDALGQTTMVK